ncbi:membrane protein [Mycobacterium phage Noelle]|uniref:Membrane protein n=1 Tax=Mycobacterium phage Noelle TaxID=2572317 RepID=A0A6B9LEE6_9CAUD|nr:membrane protein [Mycobacterium phage Noelle]QHB38118.1 membrane protein [Mycobacterium phage Noelle]
MGRDRVSLQELIAYSVIAWGIGLWVFACLEGVDDDGPT